MSSTARAPLPPVDHLVWGGPSLEQEIERLETLTGVRAAIGGRHPDEGTRNALIRIGPTIYLELISPDPTQAPPPHPRWFDLDTLTEPRLITWAAKAADLEQRAARARADGVELGEVRRSQRELSNGQVLSWRLTYPDMRLGTGLVPFLIDWGQSPHPAQTAPGDVQLLELWAEHPDPATIRAPLRQLGLDLDVVTGAAPALIAVLDTPRGRVELR
ncbi:MAG: VOC family protein [Gemmatimonadales bacterium]